MRKGRLDTAWNGGTVPWFNLIRVRRLRAGSSSSSVLHELASSKERIREEC
jgi:hypothetical protein